MLAVLFDIGGTNTRLAVTRDGRRFGQPVIYPTVNHFARGIRAFEEHARVLSHGQRVTAAAGGIAGLLARDRRTMLRSPHVGGWARKPIVAKLEQAFHAPVMLENDADVVGLGEAHYGAGRGYDIVAYLTVSTGVGGTRIVHGRFDAQALGLEPGHHYLEGDSDLEDLIGGKALQRRYGKLPKEITSPAVWRSAAKMLGKALANVTVFWSPDVIVLGGSLFKPGAISIPLTREYLKRYRPHVPKVVRGTLGDIGGLYGALAMLRFPSRRKGGGHG